MKSNINQYFYFQSLIMTLLMMSILVMGHIFDIFTSDVYIFVCYLSLQPHLLELSLKNSVINQTTYYRAGLFLTALNTSYFIAQVNFNYTISALVILMNSYLFIMCKGVSGWLKYTSVFTSSIAGLFFFNGKTEDYFNNLPVEILIVAYISILIFIIVAANYSFMRESQLSLSKKSLEREATKLQKLISGVSKYISPTIVNHLMESEEHFKINHSRKELVVFFSDICDFTRISEDLSPEDLNYLLNDYFHEMTEIASKHGGTIDKFIGDAVMIFFGDPTTLGAKQDTKKCIEMAKEMQYKMPQLNAKWKKMGFMHKFSIRIGINQGWAAVGNFGSKQQMSYTAIGQAVNLASRLEQACPEGSILVSDKVRLLTHNIFNFEPLGSKQFKGIASKIEVYMVKDTPQEVALLSDEYKNLKLRDVEKLILDLEELKSIKQIEESYIKVTS